MEPTRRPHPLQAEAIVLGAHPKDNIGGTIAKGLRDDFWHVWDPDENHLDVTESLSFHGDKAWKGDALVYAPGFVHVDWIWAQSYETIKKQIDITLTGALAAVQAFVAANGLAPNKPGDAPDLKRILIIGSAAAETPHRGQVAYNAAKAGLRMAVLTLGRELHGQGYRIFLMEPGQVPGTPYHSDMEYAVERMGLDPVQSSKRGTFNIPCTPEAVADLAVRIINGKHDWLAGRPIPFSGGPQ